MGAFSVTFQALCWAFALQPALAIPALEAVPGYPNAYKALKPSKTKFSTPNDDPNSPSRLFKRQYCPTGQAYCSRYDFCCYEGNQCCPSGCVPGSATDCCDDGGYCINGDYCCGYDGCVGPTDECCSDGNYCPSPFVCIKLYSTGDIVCCTDTTCDVYLDVNGNTQTLSEQATTYYSTARTTYDATLSYDYYAYSTTIYWYYWYYFYTIRYSPSTYTTRTSTTVTRTTTVTYSATDSYDASVYFASLESDLPTPASALSTIPPTPTAGAVVVGECSSTSTLDDGEVTSECDSTTAGRSTSSTRSSGNGNNGGDSSSSGGGASSAAVVGVTWVGVLCMLAGLGMGILMVAL